MTDIPKKTVPAHLQEVPVFSHDLDYTPRSVSNSSVYALMADMGVKPEELADNKDREKYEKYLKKHAKAAK